MRSTNQHRSSQRYARKATQFSGHYAKRAALGRMLNLPKDKAALRESLLAEYDRMGMLWDAAFIEAAHKVLTRK